MGYSRTRGSQFASDNTAGMAPEALEVIREANCGYCRSYGEDEWTLRATDSIRELFDTDCEVFFVFNGTAANSLALASLCRSYHSIICHELAHIETDECGGPEFFTHGTKLLTVNGSNGKIDPLFAEQRITSRIDIHYPRPKVISITQSTEAGTLYSIDELEKIGELARTHNLHIHMDGARFSNAVAALDVHPSEISWKRGVDLLCFGGTKNGMASGEAVVFFNKELAHEFDYRCKQAGQLASKMRFIAAPWAKMLQSGTWLLNAHHANRMAGLLAQKLSEFDFVKIAHPCEANALFLTIPLEVSKGLKEMGWVFHDFFASGNVRFMCSWNTEIEDVEMLVGDFRSFS